MLDEITNYTIVGEQAVPDWDNEQAVTIFEQLLHRRPAARSTASSPPTTASAGAVISILEKNGRAGQVPVTGQDATVEGLQNILAGTSA